jgi:hypothetical protein
MKSFKILSIDGGGIKGLYSIRVIQHLEEKYGCHISDYFDMICGTSTGGLIALALSLKIPAKTICAFYESEGRNIFPYRTRAGGFIRQVLWFGKYSDAPLKKALVKIFSDKKMGDVQNLICIPSYSITEGKPRVFKYDHREGELNMDNRALCVDVALATSAAPTYFPLCEIPYYNSSQFIDGGVWANNPTMVGLIEALKYFVGNEKAYESLDVLSISSLTYSKGKPIGRRRRRSFIGWRDDLFETSITAQSFFADHFMQHMTKFNNVKVNYLRIPSEEISSEQKHLVQLDTASKKAIEFIKGRGDLRGTLVIKDPEVQYFFQNQKSYKL